MVDPTELKRLEAEVQRLEASMEAERLAAKRASRLTLGFAAVIASVVLVFLAINYLRVRSELTPEKLTRSLEQEMHEFGPTALREMNILGQDLLPVYAAEWKLQLEAAWPEIATRVQAEFGKLARNLAERTHDQLAACEGRLLARLTDVVVRTNPDLASPTRRAEIERRIHAACDTALERALLDFDGLFSRDVARLEDTILGFDVSDGEESKVDLQKKFLHLWLRLLDEEIMKI